MPHSDSTTLSKPPQFPWTRYRTWARAATPLWLWHIGFLAVLLVVTRSDIVDAVYLALVLFPALAIVGIADIRTMLSAWTVRFALAFLLFLWLTPLWTGGIGKAHWTETALATVTVASFVMLTAHLAVREADHQDRLLKALAIVALAMTAYSAATEYGSHWFTERLVIVPWASPDIGAAVIGLLLIGVAAGPGMNAEEWPGMRLIYFAVAALLAICLILTQAHTATMSALIAALACVLVRPPKLRHAAFWAPPVLIAVALLVVIARAWLIGGYADWSALLGAFWTLVQGHVWLGFGGQGQVLLWHNGAYLTAPPDMLMSALTAGGVVAVVLLAAVYLAAIAAGVLSARRGLSLAPLAMAVYVAVYGLFRTIGVATPGWQWLVLWLPLGLVAGAELKARGGATA